VRDKQHARLWHARYWHARYNHFNDLYSRYLWFRLTGPTELLGLACFHPWWCGDGAAQRSCAVSSTWFGDFETKLSPETTDLTINRGKEAKRQRGKEAKRQRDKETKRQRDKETLLWKFSQKCLPVKF